MSDRNFETTFQYAAIGIALAGEQGRFLRVNPAFCRITGYEESELLTLSTRQLTFPPDLAESDRLIFDLWHGRIDRYELEKRYVRKGGATVWVLVSVSAVRNPDEAISHFIVQVQDITKRREAEAARRAGDLRYRAITEATSDVVVMTDLNGIVEYVSPSAGRYGWRTEDVVGHSFLDRLHPEDVAVVEEGTRRLFRYGEVSPLRWRARRGDDGDWRWFESRPSILLSEGDQPKIIDVVRDIHDQVEADKRSAAARAAAEEATKVKSQFLANISHEIRTPLTAVLGFTELLTRRSDLPSEAEDQLRKIDIAGRGLLALVNDVIDFSKLEANQFEIRPRPTDLRELVAEVVAIFSAAAGAKSLSLLTQVDEGLGPRSCDPDRIRQMLCNLVSNAIKFTSAGSVQISLRSDVSGDGVIFEVTDTGPGISLEARSNLFKRFSQVNGERNRNHGGAGLGLAITRGMAETIGGEVSLQSAPGLGSTFQLCLPAPAVTTFEAETSHVTTDISGASVLVVDDNAANRAVAQEILAILGVNAVCAESGEQALLILQDTTFDAILMDIRMPQMDGPEKLYRLRNRFGPNQRAPVIAFTADVERSETAFADFDGFVAKPIDTVALVRTLAEAFGRDERFAMAADTPAHPLIAV